MDRPDRSTRRDAGFTLVELLVVILILGLLAAIAVPAFFTQRGKANDADAKVAVRTAETALVTWASDHDGQFSGVTAGDLQAIEPTLSGAALSVPGAGSDTYELAVTSTTGNVFEIHRAPDGTRDFPCATAGRSGCPASGAWR
jgi:type IV pilus assembly protein PilA